MPPSADPVLGYADPPFQSGIVVERLEQGLRLMVPPKLGWRNLGSGYWVSLSLFGGITLFWVFFCHSNPGAWSQVALYGVIFLLIALRALSSLCERLVFTIADGKLVAEQFVGRRRYRARSWSFRNIAEIKRNPYNQCLLVRISGKSLVHFFISRRTDVTDYVAATLLKGVEDAAQSPVSVIEIEPVTYNLRREKIGMRIALVLAAIPTIAIILFPPLLGMACYLFIPAAIVAGITLGEQKNKFWT